jgi:hypothetical protein
MPLGDLSRNDMWSMHAKFYEFSMHNKCDINLPLFSFSELYPSVEHEFRRFEYMTKRLQFKRFQRNLFHIFVSYSLFSMNFQT